MIVARGIERPSRRPSEDAENDCGPNVDMSVVCGLMEHKDWEGVTKYFHGVPDASFAKSSTGNLALHEACRLEAPMSIIELLLQKNEDAVRTKGQFGYLPLHFACCSGAEFEIVAKLIEIHPASLRIRDHVDDVLPLHLAAKWGASEDVLMEILTAHPEGSFITDSMGKTPIDLAEDLPDEEVRSCTLNALATAPILVSTARAAAARVSLEWETRMKGVKEAHAEFIRQMEERQDDERTEFLKMEVGFHNELAEEKERNIVLAEKIIETKTRKEELEAELEEIKLTLEKERAEFRHKSESRERELSTVIQQSLALEPSEQLDNSQQQQSLQQQLMNLTTKYSTVREERNATQKDLIYNETMVKNLNQLLTSKDETISSQDNMLQEKEAELKSFRQRSSELEISVNQNEIELKSTKEEVSALKELTESQQQQLSHKNRMLHLQESRLGSIKSLVASLTYNIETWALDDADWDQKTIATTQGPTVLEGLETVHLKAVSSTPGIPVESSNPSVATPNNHKKKESDKSVSATNETSGIDDEDISTLSPFQSPDRMNSL